jgi:cyclopropane fatty-acyl-phospholipid synthase-like methyltransferase
MSNSPKDMWNNRFSAETYLFGTAPNTFLASQQNRLTAGQRVLSLADGEGRNGVYMAQQGCDVLAVDFSAVALAKSQKLAAERQVKIETREVDHNSWSPDADTFDLVAAIFIQFAGPDLRTKVFDDIKQALKPGGMILMQGYRPEQIEYGTGGPPNRENMYTEDLLRSAFDDFEILELNVHDSEINEGPGHDGISALIDMVAVRP